MAAPQLQLTLAHRRRAQNFMYALDAHAWWNVGIRGPQCRRRGGLVHVSPLGGESLCIHLSPASSYYQGTTTAPSLNHQANALVLLHQQHRQQKGMYCWCSLRHASASMYSTFPTSVICHKPFPWLVTSYCLNSAHRLCQVTWHSGLLAKLKEHIIVGVCCLSQYARLTRSVKSRCARIWGSCCNPLDPRNHDLYDGP